MNQTEFATFAMALKTYYPRENQIPNKQAMELWYGHLRDIPYKIAEVALNKWVATNKWSPTISEIREMCVEVETDDIPDWASQWELVLQNMNKYGRERPKSGVANLHPIAQETMKSFDWWNLCTSTNLATERANFREIYIAKAQKAKEAAKLSPDLQEAINNIRIEGSNYERKAISTEG